MQDAYTSYKDRGFQILTINLDGNVNLIRDFVNRFDYEFKVLMGDSAIANQYRIRFVPRTFILDQRGVIRFEQTGPMTYEEISNIVNQLLN